jgi:hypothetical protein
MLIFDNLPDYSPRFDYDAIRPRIPRAWRGYIDPFVCHDDPPPPAPPAPPPADVELPPTPPRVAGQSDTERAQQLEGILAEVRAEAAVRRIGKREAESRATALQNELATIRADADRREQTARTEGEARTNKVKQRALDAEIRAAAVTAGLRDPDLLPLIDRTGVTIDDDGNVAGVEAAITAFKTKKPEYFQATLPARANERIDVRTGSPAPPAPPPGLGGNSAPTDVRKMPAADYKAARRAALRSLG